VLGVDKDGDAIVNVGNQQWIFSPAALVLESKEHERQPPSSEAVRIDHKGEFIFSMGC